ncbi:MAG TPA: ribonuclease Y [Thermosynergistes sp.]|jgi:ribonuclease Y|nr:ribonuclease Y [Thermosynergistes sp.]
MNLDNRIGSDCVMEIVLLIGSTGIGIAAGFAICKVIEQKRLKGTRKLAEQLLQEAQKEAERKKREILTEAKEAALQIRQDLEREIKDRRAELQRAERRIEQKEESLDKRLENLNRKDEEIRNRLAAIEKQKREIERLHEEELARLQEIAQMSCEEARQHLLARAEEEAAGEIGLRIKEIEEKVRRESARRAREIIATAIQRCAVDHTSEATVSVVNLPSDEMKGRIIGREGRNIRAFEMLTGVDLIVDDTPEAVTLSSFDPVRREVARISLERLIVDGRIHPARIEEIVEKVSNEVEETIIEAGEEALLEANVKGVHPELVKVLGQLRFRASFGQNTLVHSLEVAKVAGLMAAELGVEESTARRAGLLHDIGKAIDHNTEGSHALIGADLAKRYGESDEIVNAIASHHEEVEPKSIYAVLIAAADAVSASRPGARKEDLDAYIKRLEKLEQIAKSFKGVDKAFAIQAGREVRVMVSPAVADDGAVYKLCYEIAKKVENEMKYPGQIKITVIREMRAVEYAK